MWAIGVKTAATCDTIDGLSVKESAPPSRREATRFPPGPSPASSESRPDVGVGRTGPVEELEARRILRIPATHGGRQLQASSRSEATCGVEGLVPSGRPPAGSAPLGLSY